MRRHLLRPTILTLLVAAVPVLALTAGAADAADAADAAGPRAAIAEPVVDAGEVPRGEHITTTFVVENKGTAPLEITEVRPACGCTVADYDSPIAPGSTGKVKTVLDTTSFAGPIAKGITVFTNDPANPRLQLTVKAEVKPFLYVHPGYARYTMFVQKDRDQTMSQILIADDFEDLEIVGVKTPSPWVEVSYRPAHQSERRPEGKGNQWRVDVTLKKDAPIGPVAEQVLIETNHPKQTRVEIPVSGFVRPIVAVTPPQIDFGAIDTSDPQPWGVLVRNFGSSPLDLTVRNGIQGLDVEVEPVEAGRQYRVLFTPRPTMAKGPFDGEVVIATNMPQQETITVEVRGNVR